MVGRMAYNTPWDLVRVDRELYGDTEDTKNREQLLTVCIYINLQCLQEYAEYCQQEQDEWVAKSEYIPNSLFVKPIINLFSHEYEGTQYKKALTERSLDKQYKGKIRECIIDTMNYYKTINPESLESRNGVKVLRPKSYYEELHLKQALQK